MFKQIIIYLLAACSLWSCKEGNVEAAPIPHQNMQREVKVLHSQASDLNPKVLKMALTAYDRAKARGMVQKPIITIIDYSKKSTQKRLWVVDLSHHKVPYHTYVAHGRNSGNLTAQHFSNQPGSKETSLGVYLTKETYIGHNGLSLKLSGLEKGINDNAYKRAIVVHGAQYVNNGFIQGNGFVGRSWGCPALPAALAKPIINLIKQGSLIFAYYPNKEWLKGSSFLE